MTKQEQETTERAAAFYASRLKMSVATATKADCEDLAGDIRARVCESLKKVGDRRNVTAYIFKSAFFAYKQYRRKYCVRKAREIPLGEDVESPALSIGDIANAETARAIRAAVDGIGNKRNRDICRAYFDGKTRSDIARAHSITVTRVTGILRANLQGVWLKLRDGDI